MRIESEPNANRIRIGSESNQNRIRTESNSNRIQTDSEPNWIESDPNFDSDSIRIRLTNTFTDFYKSTSLIPLLPVENKSLYSLTVLYFNEIIQKAHFVHTYTIKECKPKIS